jgi:hypothetical protein
MWSQSANFLRVMNPGIKMPPQKKGGKRARRREIQIEIPRVTLPTLLHAWASMFFFSLVVDCRVFFDFPFSSDGS